MGHAVRENRHGLTMSVSVGEANGHAECDAAIAMADDLRGAKVQPRTLGADRGFDSGPCLIALGSRGVTPHTALRSGVIGGAKGTGRLHRKSLPLVEARERMKRRTRTAAYRLSQRARKKT